LIHPSLTRPKYYFFIFSGQYTADAVRAYQTPKSMRLGLNPVLEVEAAINYEGNSALPLTGQVFYVLENSAADILKTSKGASGYEKALEVLRSTAIDFIITDSRGKAVVKKLEAKTYYVCGISQTHQGVGIWNVRVDLQFGKNSLVLDNNNMIGK
jgi:hypothetical protein